MQMLKLLSLCLVCTIVLAACGESAHQDEHQNQDKNADSGAVKPAAKVSGAMSSLHYLHAARSFPEAELPQGAWYSAWQEVQQARRQKSSDQILFDGKNWEALGPQNLGGRTLALCINPLNTNTIYAGSASGGLWRTYNGGEGATAWQRVATKFPVLAVGAIAINPLDTNTIYIGTGEVYNPETISGGLVNRITRGSYGIGILKSNDAGQSWKPVLDWTRESERGVQVVRLNPKNPQVVLAGTTIGLLRSTNSGDNWFTVLNVPMITDVVIDPDDPDIQFAAAGNFGSAGHGIYRSLDGGESWERLTNGLPSSYNGKTHLAYRPGSQTESSVIYASIGDGANNGSASWVARSRDIGDSWDIIDNNVTNHAAWQGWYSHDISPHPTRDDEYVVAGVLPFRSVNGAVRQVGNWRRAYLNTATAPGEPLGPPEYCHADCHDIVRDPNNPEKVYLATDGGIFVSETGGTANSFRNLNGGYQVAQFYNGFASSPQDPDFAMGGLQDNFVVAYAGSLGWKRMIPGDGTWTAIHPQSDDIIFGSTQFLNVQFSRNGGETWFSVNAPQFGPRAFVAPFVQKPSAPGEIYGGSNPLYSYSIQSESAQFANPFDDDQDIPLAIDVSHQDPDVLYVTTMQESGTSSRAKVYSSSNAGSRWQDVSATLPNRFPLDIKVDPLNDQIVYVVFGGYGEGQFFRSADGGASWEDRSSGLPAIPTHAVAVDPFNPEHIYVGNEFGVWFSRDSGKQWTELFSNAPEVMHVMDLSVSLADLKIRAVTHGNGVYERDLVEKIPVSVANTKTQVEMASVAIAPNPVQNEAQITLSLEAPARISIQVYTIAGRPVLKIPGANSLPAGEHTIPLQMRMANGSTPAAGMHILHIMIDDQRLTKAFLFVP